MPSFVHVLAWAARVSGGSAKEEELSVFLHHSLGVFHRPSVLSRKPHFEGKGLSSVVDIEALKLLPELTLHLVHLSSYSWYEVHALNAKRFICFLTIALRAGVRHKGIGSLEENLTWFEHLSPLMTQCP